MKSSEFKKIVKSAVKEAIQEELKDILFEAFKSPLNFTSNDVQSFVPQQSGDSVNGNLGGGSVSMDQISSLMGK